MTITVLNRTWEIEIWPASPDQAPNAIYLQVRHKPPPGRPNQLPGAIRFGLTEEEAHRIARALVEGSTGDRATDVLRSWREHTEPTDVAPKLTRIPEPMGAMKPQFTKTQGRYLAFIHRYIAKFGQAPAEADIQRHFLVSAPSVNAMMQTLTRKGFISRVPGAPRSIKLLVPSELLPTD